MRQFMAAALAVLMALPAAAADLGEDGLHKAPWMRETFKDLLQNAKLAMTFGET